MTAVLPPARVAIAGNAPPSREWYRYFQASTQVNLDVGTLRHDVDALTVRVTALEDAPPSIGDIKITGTGSIYVSATAVKVVSLEGDEEEPGFTTYYGTDATGAKGWYAVSDALASSGNIAKSTDAAGVTSFDLVDLADSGTGAALVKITRDAKGRVSGTSAATTTDLAEGDNLYFTDARVRATALTGLSTATATPVTATDSVLVGVGKLQAQITDNLLPPGYIDGLQMQWVSGTAITVASGSAYIAGSARVLRATADIAKTGLSLIAATWYHVYLYDNAGTPDVEVVTTAPAAPYNGTARIKTGDASRRYLGSIRTGSDTAIYNFVHASGRVLYRENIADGILPFRVLSNGMSTTDTVISCTDVVPVTSKVATLRLQNTSTVGGFRVKQSDGTYSSGPGPAAQTVSPGGLGIFDLPLNSSQQLIYFFLAAPSSGGYIDVCGYSFDR